jgi:D-threo-aldose 1-dehydrogenase
LRARASAYNSICGSFGVSLAAAALHFSMRDARISSTAVGASSSERVLETIRMAQQVIPDDLWPALDAVG